ncbi:MAG: DHH family phosphoesterase [Solirubrobacteraceae bacterium]|nr:DHH family phosphoesterase [Solirubrobacteraceae bacterium]
MSADGAAGRGALVELLRSEDRFVVVTHEQPDGDALGSLVATARILAALGKDVVAVVGPADLPLPREYARLETIPLPTRLPDDVGERIAVFVDCGNVDRCPVAVHGVARSTVNIDHHHDNTRFADLDLVEPDAACTTEILWSLLPELGVALDPELAVALYVGLVTDSGRFMYGNTGGRSHLMAAELIGAGVEPFPVYRTLYERFPWAKLALLGRALERVRRLDAGRLTFSHLRRRDFDETGAVDSDAEGIIDHLRGVEETRVAALAREIVTGPDGPIRTKVSLRSADGVVDVSVIARAGGGGGHRQAAGFTTDLSEEELVRFLSDRVADVA